MMLLSKQTHHLVVRKEDILEPEEEHENDKGPISLEYEMCTKKGRKTSAINDILYTVCPLLNHYTFEDDQKGLFLSDHSYFYQC